MPGKRIFDNPRTSNLRTEGRLQGILQALDDGFSIPEAANRNGVAPRTFHSWMQEDPDLRQEVYRRVTDMKVNGLLIARAILNRRGEDGLPVGDRLGLAAAKYLQDQVDKSMSFLTDE